MLMTGEAQEAPETESGATECSSRGSVPSMPAVSVFSGQVIRRVGIQRRRNDRKIRRSGSTAGQSGREQKVAKEAAIDSIISRRSRVGTPREGGRTVANLPSSLNEMLTGSSAPHQINIVYIVTRPSSLTKGYVQFAEVSADTPTNCLPLPRPACGSGLANAGAERVGRGACTTFG